ncbi:MAG: hypothetical protein HFI38_12140 [Lachnospiraceae bacterium]|jgi:hypothetical protein|nr:hypothetical protein [Lachnospiraceae bacterium]
MTVVIMPAIIIVLFVAFLFTSEKVFEGTNFYKNKYSETDKLWGTDKVDFVNTGSTFAFYGLEYDVCGVKGLNLALKPQSIEEDFRMLRHFESRYNESATVFIVISDLAFAKKEYTDSGIVDKYYKVLNSREIDHFNPFRALRARYFPVLYSWKNILRFYRDIKPDNEYDLKVNENDIEAVEADAYKRCQVWMEEFKLRNLSDGSQGERFLNVFTYTTEIVANMISWCKERGYRPVLVNLPVAEKMKNSFSNEFLDTFYYNNINRAINKSKMEDVLFIDLQKSEKLSDYLLYLDSCRLNKAGREIVTKVLLRKAGNMI